jgi:hypothetical protein
MDTIMNDNAQNTKDLTVSEVDRQNILKQSLCVAGNREGHAHQGDSI